MSTLTLPLALGGAARSSRQKYRPTLAQALRFVGSKALNPVAVSAYMAAQRRAHSDSLPRRLAISCLSNVAFNLLLAGVFVILVAAFFAAVAVCCVTGIAYCCGVEGGKLAGCGGSAIVAAASVLALLALNRFAEVTDGLSARFAAWRVVPYQANGVPVWVREIAAGVGLRCPGATLRVHELIQNKKVVDPALEAICPVTGKSFFLAVWDADGEKVSLPEAP